MGNTSQLNTQAAETGTTYTVDDIFNAPGTTVEKVNGGYILHQNENDNPYYRQYVNKKDNDYGMLTLERAEKGTVCAIATGLEVIAAFLEGLLKHVYGLGIAGAVISLIFMCSDVIVTDGPQFFLCSTLLALSPFLCQAIIMGLDHLKTVFVVPNDDDIEEMRKYINGEPSAFD